MAHGRNQRKQQTGVNYHSTTCSQIIRIRYTTRENHAKPIRSTAPKGGSRCNKLHTRVRYCFQTMTAGLAENLKVWILRESSDVRRALLFSKKLPYFTTRVRLYNFVTFISLNESWKNKKLTYERMEILIWQLFYSRSFYEISHPR
jgi:hypothetical protein